MSRDTKPWSVAECFDKVFRSDSGSSGDGKVKNRIREVCRRQTARRQVLGGNAIVALVVTSMKMVLVESGAIS